MQSNISNPEQCLDQCHILQLNNDCFYEVYEFLSPIDWCSLRETCTRLRTISDYWFHRQHERFDLHPKIVYGTEDVLFSLNDSARLIRNFGHFMTTLAIDKRIFIDEENPETLLPLVDRYCIALKNLRCYGLVFDTTTVVQCDRLFSNLHRLEFDECEWDNADTFQFWMVRSTSLKELKFHLVDINGIVLDHRFESLNSFEMISCYSLNPDSLGQFFAKNHQLKKIKLLRNELDRKMNVFEDAVIKLPNLESLSLINNDPNLIPEAISTVRKLELDVGCTKYDTINQLFADLAAHNSVENLFLFELSLSESVIERLCQLKSLKILKLLAEKDLNDVTIRKLARELPAVLEIHFYSNSGMTFNQIKEFVIHVVTLKRIIFDRSFNCFRESLTKEMFMTLVEARKKKENQETLSIFLDASDHVDVLKEFERNGMSDMLSSYSNVINLLPLEEEHLKNREW